MSLRVRTECPVYAWAGRLKSAVIGDDSPGCAAIAAACPGRIDCAFALGQYSPQPGVFGVFRRRDAAVAMGPWSPVRSISLVPGCDGPLRNDVADTEDLRQIRLVTWCQGQLSCFGRGRISTRLFVQVLTAMTRSVDVFRHRSSWRAFHPSVGIRGNGEIPSAAGQALNGRTGSCGTCNIENFA